MKWIDVSLTLSKEQASWLGDDPFKYWETRRIADGNNSNCASLSMSLHFGTHIDAPYHFVPDGKTVDDIEPDQLIGPCSVVSAEEAKGLIEPKDLEGKIPEGTTRLIVKSRNSAYILDKTFHTDFTAFSEECAKFLVERGIQLLGFDYFSIARYKNTAPAHRVLLGAGMVIIENLNLTEIDPGEYEIICLPLKIKGSGGAPARVVLRQQ